jgi:hypothetical protein
MENHPIKLGKDQDCGDCVHEFLCMDYEKNIEMIERLSTYKLAYQRMFITLFVTVGAIFLAIVQLPGISIADEVVSRVGLNHLLGLTFVGTAVLGYLIVKNLASTRVSEMFFCRSIRKIRQIYAQQLNLPDWYPQLLQVPVRAMKSADYQVIITLSAFNAAYLACGISLSLYDPNRSNPLSMCVISIVAVLAYVTFHIFQIEVYLQSGGQKFSQATMGQQKAALYE